MEVKFDTDITVKDMYKFLLNNTYRRFTGIVWVIFTCMVVFITIYTWGTMELVYSIILIVLALIYALNPVVLYFKAKSQIKNTSSFQKSLNYVLDDEGIKISQDDANAEVAWDEIWKIVRYGSEVIVYVSSVRAFIWPVRCIEDRYDDIVKITSEHMRTRSHLVREKKNDDRD